MINFKNSIRQLLKNDAVINTTNNFEELIILIYKAIQLISVNDRAAFSKSSHLIEETIESIRIKLQKLDNISSPYIAFVDYVEYLYKIKFYKFLAEAIEDNKEATTLRQDAIMKTIKLKNQAQNHLTNSIMKCPHLSFQK